MDGFYWGKMVYTEVECKSGGRGRSGDLGWLFHNGVGLSDLGHTNPQKEGNVGQVWLVRIFFDNVKMGRCI